MPKEYFYDDDRCAYDSKYKLLTIGKLEFCGCMNQEVIEDILRVLKDFSMRGETHHTYYTDMAKRLKFDEKYLLLIYQYLDGLGFLEHGTAIRGSWLTEKGERLIEDFKEFFIISMKIDVNIDFILCECSYFGNFNEFEIIGYIENDHILLRCPKCGFLNRKNYKNGEWK